MKCPQVEVWFAGITIGLALAGCGPSGNGKAIVSGTVAYEGVRLNQGSVIFSGENNLSGMSAIDPRGRYKAQLFPGRYDVAIRSEEPSTFGSNGLLIPGKSLIPERYDDIRTSGLSVSIEKGRNEENFDLKP